jgi:hypothetical protein
MSLKLEMNVEVLVSTEDGGFNIESGFVCASVEHSLDFEQVVLSGLSDKGVITLEQLNKLVTAMEYITNNQ